MLDLRLDSTDSISFNLRFHLTKCSSFKQKKTSTKQVTVKIKCFHYIAVYGFAGLSRFQMTYNSTHDILAINIMVHTGKFKNETNKKRCLAEMRKSIKFFCIWIKFRWLDFINGWFLSGMWSLITWMACTFYDVRINNDCFAVRFNY